MDPISVNNNLNSSSAKNDNTKKHTVKSGENLTLIAKKYGVTVKAIIEANPSITNENKDHLKPGMKINIPLPKLDKEDYLYEVMRGYGLDGESIVDVHWDKALKEFQTVFPTGKGQVYKFTLEGVRKELGQYNKVIDKINEIEKQRVKLYAEYHVHNDYKVLKDGLKKLDEKTAKLPDVYNSRISILMNTLSVSGVAFEVLKEDPEILMNFDPENSYEIFYDIKKYNVFSAIRGSDFKLIQDDKAWTAENVMKMINAITKGDNIIGEKTSARIEGRINKRIDTFRKVNY